MALPRGTELLYPVEVTRAVTGTSRAAVPTPHHGLCLWSGGSDWSSGEGRAPSPGSCHPTGTMGQGHRTVLLPNSYSISPISNALSLRTGTEAREARSRDWQRVKLCGSASHGLLEGEQDLQG